MSRPHASWARQNSTTPFGLADAHVRGAEPDLEAERQFVAATAHRFPAGIAVADSLLDPSDREALRRDRTQGRQPRMIDGAGRLDEFFGPGNGFEISDHYSK